MENGSAENAAFLDGRVKSFAPESALSDEQLFRERREAREQKAQRDRWLLKVHHYVVHVMTVMGKEEEVLQKAKARVALWEEKSLCSPYFYDEWKRILCLPMPQLAEAITRDDAIGIAFRQNTPFSFLMREVP